jgi:hypothetical protein
MSQYGKTKNRKMAQAISKHPDQKYVETKLKEISNN